MSETGKTPEEIQKEKEEIEKSRDSWKTWGIISIIGAVFFFILAILFLIFIIKYRKQLSVKDAFNSMRDDIGEGFNSLGNKIKTYGGCDCSKGGCGACVVGGCDCTKGGCGCDMTGGAVNSSNFLNKLLKKN